ncbi:4-alpha-glucanotransferase [Streptomyces aidingensis]|uniref:4-alpha-glucanotransferase n=1 Tax=Streptomyces aidingensis TaxID=910347 RepID=A0A1I1FCT1_9ACTN|nr:4-alpha-glucanotransferase [Streptomyces aidingensis]SFB96756.1 4-alpha-glucanotransferase [Streptomyces aidingensis]
MTALARLAEAYGVATAYEPSPGHRVEIADDTVIAVLGAFGVDATTPGAARDALERHEQERAERLLPPTLVLNPGTGPADPPGLPPGTELGVACEDGRTLPWSSGLPPGCHTLHATTPDARAARCTLIVPPGPLPAPPGRRHGLLVQLYSVLSRRSWGMGDLADLAELAGWAGRSLGSGFLQLNPLHAAVPGASGEATDPSPYRPGNRRFPDPVHLRVEDIPEYAYLEPAGRERVDALRTRAAALREAVLDRGVPIDRDAVWQLKREALELIKRDVPLSAGRQAAYVAFLAAGGRSLEDHATWCALAELYGPDWRSWPAGLRDPRSGRTARARNDLMERVDFHCWLVWQADEQLARAQRTAREAGMPVGLVQDLALGVHPQGSEAWTWQEALAPGVTVGAPPDAFNAKGQDWGVPAWRPDVLAATGYLPYRELLTGLLRHAGGIRVDHVMSHYRLWWVPEGAPPTQGTYVSYDADAMFAVLSLAADRAGALVVGEDLGTVAPGVREDLQRRGLHGTSVLWFERDWAGRERRDAADRAAGERGRPGRPRPRRRSLRWAALARATGVTGEDQLGGTPLTMPDGEGGGRAGRSGQAAAGGAAAPALPPPLRPEQWRAACLATVTTHDLPPTAARITGDGTGWLELREELGLLPQDPEAERAAARADNDDWLRYFTKLGLLAPGAGEEERITAAYRFLARTPARLIGLWLPDGVGDRRPQNVPGTWREYPNWRLPVADPAGRPVTLETLAGSERLRSLAAAVTEELAARPAEPEPPDGTEGTEGTEGTDGTDGQNAAAAAGPGGVPAPGDHPGGAGASGVG